MIAGPTPALRVLGAHGALCAAAAWSPQ